jgi:pimeloyl-ACP methyl ester carboxylesterase
MAADALGVMAALGHDRFAVAGHDRGALVAFRLGLDHPESVTHVVTVGVIPGLDMWDALRGVAGVFAWHLAFLAQPGDLPQRLIGADPEAFFGHFLDQWSQSPETVPDDVRRAYLAELRTADGIRGVCEDYRAGAFVDPAHDAADRAAGRRLAMPVLAVWEDPGDLELPFDPAAVWRSWADNLRTLVLPGGHFLPEAQPTDLADAIAKHLTR